MHYYIEILNVFEEALRTQENAHNTCLSERGSSYQPIRCQVSLLEVEGKTHRKEKNNFCQNLSVRVELWVIFTCLFNVFHSFPFSKFSTRRDFDQKKLLLKKNDYTRRMLRFSCACGKGILTIRGHLIQVTNSSLQVRVKALRQRNQKKQGEDVERTCAPERFHQNGQTLDVGCIPSLPKLGGKKWNTAYSRNPRISQEFIWSTKR